MKKKIITLLLSFTLAGTFLAGCADNNKTTDAESSVVSEQIETAQTEIESNVQEEQTHTEKALALINTFATGDTDTARKLLADGYIQHNLAYGTGADAFISSVEYLASAEIKTTVNNIRAFEDGDKYIQHNTSIADGLSGLGAALEAMAKQGISMVYNKTHMVLADGDYALACSEGTFGGVRTTYYDLFRVENGFIAEHWDVMETLADKSTWANENGKF